MSVYFGARRESTSSAPGNSSIEIDLSGDNSSDCMKGDFLDNEMNGTIEIDGQRIESVDAQSSDDDIDRIHDVHIPDCKLSRNGSDDDDDDNDDGNGNGHSRVHGKLNYDDDADVDVDYYEYNDYA